MNIMNMIFLSKTLTKISILDCILKNTEWSELTDNPRYAAKKMEDQISYLWDALIENFNFHFREGTLHGNVNFSDHELGVRKMAALSRFERRTIGKRIAYVQKHTALDQRRASILKFDSQPNITFIILLIPWSEHLSYEQNIDIRASYLLAYCNVYRLKHKQTREAVAIGMSHFREGKISSETPLYCDFSVWTPEMEEHAREDQTTLGVLTKEVYSDEREHEFPEVEEVWLTPSDRLPPQGQNRRTRRRLAALARGKHGRG